MKKVYLPAFLLIAFALVLVTSCEKQDKACPVVASEQVPTAVTNSFTTKYAGAAVTTWFNKDNKGYCADFTLNGTEMKALFDNNGNFMEEEVEGKDDHQSGNHADDDGCECELED